jgi:hypothetical protein
MSLHRRNVITLGGALVTTTKVFPINPGDRLEF